MACWRIDISRRLIRYLDNELPPQQLNRIESHLLDCNDCRARLAELKQGKRLAEQLPSVKPVHDPWQAIEAAIATPAQPAPTRPQMGRQVWQWSNLLRQPAITFILLFTTVLLSVLLIGSRLEFFSRQTEQPQFSISVAEFDEEDEYRTVAISDMHNNTAPHVVAEGFVSEVRIDPDGDLTFRLVEDLQRPNPFIVCEIISPIRMAAPTLGSRVRVYGVSRFDAKENHRWYEVHPVLNIELVSK